MKYMFIIVMLLFFIMVPFVYLLYKFREVPYKYKLIFTMITFLSLFIFLIKSFFQLNMQWFFVITNVVQFYIITVIVFSILCLLYSLFCYILHQGKLNRIFIFFIAISFCLTAFGFYTHYDKTIKKYDIVVQKNSDLKNLNVAMVSDIHLSTGTYLNDIQNLVNQMNRNNYDILFFCGDIFDESTPLPMIEDTFELMSKIKTKYGMYAINGNHEHFADPIDISLYEKNNIQFLNQKYVCIDNLFNIVGRDDVSTKQDIAIQEICKNMDTSLPTIVLDHNPKRYQEVLDYADVQFSGHTHGGQFFPMTLATAPLYDNAYGLMQKDDFSLIVSSGFGSWGFPFRFLTNCEIVETKIAFSKN